MSERDQSSIDGPPSRAVAMARMWLKILGVLWLTVGVLMLGGGGNVETMLWAGAAIIFGLGHFVLARYASNRIAVFFAVLGP